MVKYTTSEATFSVTTPPLSVITRFVEPIDRTSYKHWRSSSPRVTQMVSEQPDQRSLPGSVSGVSHSRTAETSAEMEAMQLSFAEVMRLVQEGKEVPGVTKLDINPTNQTPAPSQMERILKPWEISVSK